MDFIAELFEATPDFVKTIIPSGCSGFVGQVMVQRQKEVEELDVPFDFLMQDGHILEVLRKVLLKKADFIRGMGRGREYPLLRDLLESSSDNFMRKIDGDVGGVGRGSSKCRIREQRERIRILFKAALVE